MLQLEMENTPTGSPVKDSSVGGNGTGGSDDDDDVEHAALLVERERKQQQLTKKKNKLQEAIHALRFLALLLVNVAIWYVTNGFNGIAMQSYSKRVRTLDDHVDMLLVNISIIAAVTAAQLLLGALLGYGIMKVLQSFTKSDINFKALSQEEVVAGSLHGLGSIATNLGFMYGSSSLVQILKLLEPFETLGLSQLLTPEEGKFTFGIVSSMIVVVGAAVSLIRIQSQTPSGYSIFFALLSGMSLSLRNVLQRKSHSNRSAELASANKKKQTPLQKLERSVVQFTRLSYRSGLLVGGVAVILNLMTRPQWHAFQTVNWKVVTWHPIYNIASMIVLGFCSALTHSLMNAGKRVCAILMALVWFHEDVTGATLAGLATVAGGGLWYTLESKGGRIAGGFLKVIVATSVLVGLVDYQNFVQNQHSFLLSGLKL